MLRHERSAPIWLFSFVDLAFLLLIAFTQISPPTSGAEHRLTLIEVPQIESPADPSAGSPSARSWQLRVVSAQAATTPMDAAPGDAERSQTPFRTPFELVSPSAQPRAGARPSPMGADALATALAGLRAEDEPKPVLTPHPDARAEDLLVAVGLLGEVWEQAGRAAVRPRPRVASGPPTDESPDAR